MDGLQLLEVSTVEPSGPAVSYTIGRSPIFKGLKLHCHNEVCLLSIVSIFRLFLYRRFHCGQYCYRNNKLCEQKSRRGIRKMWKI